MKPASEDKPIGMDREEETPLTLSDSTDVPSPSETPTDAARESAAGSATDADESAGSSRGSSDLGPGGTTTGGFDTLLGKLVVNSGLVTKDEVEECQALLKESSGSGEVQPLSDLLVARHYVTRHQLGRLRDEFEAKKSGQHIPGYKILRKLGSGAMATVFLARQLSLDRLVAIKILPKKFSDNEKFIERFYKEGRSAAQLNHPNIVGAYDVGRAGEHHYFVMEYVDGSTVHERITKHHRIAERQATEIVRQVARALEHAHARGFVHRDIKPKNIMIAKEGRVKLADLGLARAVSDREAAKAEAGRAYGTPYYISPEQIRGELNIGPAADIYGLGATFFHMVTGRVPFEGKSPSEVMHRHLKNPLTPPDHLNPEISAGCAQVIEMMMAKKARDRYQSATDLLEDLDLVARGEPPHFAHHTLDPEKVTEALTDVVEAPPPPRRIEPAPRESLSRSTAFMVTLVLLIGSIIANVVLLAVLLAG